MTLLCLPLLVLSFAFAGPWGYADNWADMREPETRTGPLARPQLHLMLVKWGEEVSRL
jgi:hypothetical protein